MAIPRRKLPLVSSNSDEIRGPEEKRYNIEEKIKDPGYKLPHFNRECLSPRSDKEIEVVAHDLVLWAQQEDSIVFEGFCRVSGLSNPRLYEYAKRNTVMMEAMNLARQLIGERRERRGLENKYNASIVMGTMALYSPEYRAWRKEMSQKDVEPNSVKIVVMDKYPETEEVPDKEITNNE